MYRLIFSHRLTDGKCPQTVNSSYRNSWASNKKTKLMTEGRWTSRHRHCHPHRVSPAWHESKVATITMTMGACNDRLATAFLMAIRNSSTGRCAHPILIQFSMILVMSLTYSKTISFLAVTNFNPIKREEESKRSNRKKYERGKIIAKKVRKIKELNISFQFKRI